MRDSIHAVATGALFWLLTPLVWQGASAIAAEPEIVFDPPKAVVVRQTNGAPARGDLLRIDREELHLRALNGSEVDFKLERVRSVKTSDEAFEYWPAQETFDELAGRIQSVAGAKLNGSIPRSAATGGSDSPRPGRSRAARKHEQNVGDDTIPQDDAGRGPFGNRVPDAGTTDADLLPAESTERNARPAPSGASATAVATDEPDTETEPVPGTDILVCSNCEQDLPSGFASGERCPHCGKVAVFDTGESNPFAAPAASASPQNPFAANGAAPPAAAIPAVAPAAAAPAADAGAGGLADIPLYGKIGIFAAFLVVGWLILQRR